MPDQPDKVYRLNDLEVHEVSLVDAPANQRKFLVVKNDEAAEVDAEIDKTSAEIDAAMGDKAEADTHLFAKLHPDVQAKAGSLLTKAGERLLALAQAVKAAKAEDGADPAVPAKLTDEVVSVLAALGSFAPPEAVAAAASMADPDKEKDKAAAEAEAKGKGKKKATDLAALVEAIDKADMSEEMMAVLYLTAGKEALRMAQDACYDNEYMAAAKYAHMAYMYLAKYGAASGGPAVPMQMAADLDALRESLNPVAKAGRKMSAARWAELDKSLRALLALAEEVQPGYTAALAPSGVSKADVTRLVEMLREKTETIKSLRGGGRPASNTSAPGEAPAQPQGEVAWPHDLNADYNEFDEADRF